MVAKECFTEEVIFKKRSEGGEGEHLSLTSVREREAFWAVHSFEARASLARRGNAQEANGLEQS